MYSNNLSSLKLTNFRNIAALDLRFTKKINIFFGDNGQGKTNILESIAMLCSLKSFRALKSNQDLITFGQNQLFISGNFTDNQISYSLDRSLNKRKILLNSKSIRDRQKLHERLALVTFVPDDLNIVTGSSSNRRKLLNQVSHNLYPNYATIYRQYEKALAQRNKLLKEWPIDHHSLNAFTEILADLGNGINRYRQKAFAVWEPLFASSLSNIINSRFETLISYEPASDLKPIFEARKQEEIGRRTTLTGPHLDDLEIKLNGELARFSASRGQCRAMVLAMKLAQIESIRRLRELEPILLLDDVIGELDQQNAKYLLEFIKNSNSQTVITLTHLGLLPSKFKKSQKYKNFETFEVRAGEIKPHPIAKI